MPGKEGNKCYLSIVNRIHRQFQQALNKTQIEVKISLFQTLF